MVAKEIILIAKDMIHSYARKGIFSMKEIFYIANEGYMVVNTESLSPVLGLSYETIKDDYEIIFKADFWNIWDLSNWKTNSANSEKIVNLMMVFYKLRELGYTDIQVDKWVIPKGMDAPISTCEFYDRMDIDIRYNVTDKGEYYFNP